jgi:hypothetical protein
LTEFDGKEWRRVADKAAERRAYQRGYNLINGSSILRPRSAADIIARYEAEASELRDAFMRGIEGAERTRDRHLTRLFDDGRKWLRLLAQTERAMARCWTINEQLGLGGLYDGTLADQEGRGVCARTKELKEVVKRLVDGRLLKPEVMEGL